MLWLTKILFSTSVADWVHILSCDMLKSFWCGGHNAGASSCTVHYFFIFFISILALLFQSVQKLDIHVYCLWISPLFVHIWGISPSHSKKYADTGENWSIVIFVIFHPVNKTFWNFSCNITCVCKHSAFQFERKQKFGN